MKNAALRLAVAGMILAMPRAMANQSLTMVVSPAQSLAPATLTIRLRIEPNDDNRALVVTADSGDFYRSSQIPLEGTRAPRTVFVEFPSLPGGNYEVRGTLTDTTGHPVASVAHAVVVIPAR